MTEKPTYEELEQRIKELEQAASEQKHTKGALDKQITALPHSLKNDENIAFEDIFKIDDIQRLQDQFSRATNVASIITHTDGTPITAPSNFCRLCKDIIRKTDKGLANCFKSDAVIGRFHPDGPIIRHCMSGGLWDAGAGITAGGRHIANWLIGQVRDESQTEEKMLAYARKIGASEKDVVEAFREVPAMQKEQFEWVAKALFTLANQLSANAYQNVQQTRFITERNAAEKALSESEEKYRLLADNITDNIWVLDLATLKFTYLSPSIIGITGYSANEVIGLHLQDVLTPQSMDLAINVLSKALSSESRSTDPSRSHTLELEQFHKNGSTVWTEVSVRFFHNAEGHPASILGVTRNITQRKFMEEELRESEEKYRNLYSTSMDGIMVIDAEKGMIIDVNKACEKIYGYTKEEFLTMKLTDISNEPEKSLNAIKPVMDGTLTKIPVRYHKRKNGSVFPIEVTVGTFSLKGKNVVYGVLRDISERIQAEKAIKKNESLQRKMVANIGDVIVIIDQDGINRYKSPNIEKLFGWKPEDVVGASTWENVHPEDVESAQKFFGALMHEPNAVGTTDLRYKCKDGSYRWIQFTGSNLLHDPDIAGLLGNYHDVTDRKQAEQSLRESEARFKALHNASFGGIAIHDKGVILECNQGLSKITGYSVAELIGMDGLRLIAEKSKNAVMHNIQTGYEKPYEATGLRKNGEAFPIRLEARNVPYKGKNVRVVEFRDITEQKKMEAHIQQAQKMESIGTLAGGIAHDFNNILSPILGNTEILMEDIPEDSPLHNKLDAVLEGALRARDLVRQILAFSRQDRHEIKLMRMQPVIKEALKLIRSTIPTSIEIKQTISNDCGIIKADPTQIHQVVMNLATNAYHAMEDTGGELKVSLKAIELDEQDLPGPGMTPGSHALLTVADTGTGIDENLRGKIFDPYFTTKKLGKGTGMGLPVIHGIVQNSGGSIHVDSTPGKGTEFHVYLPVVQKSFKQHEIQTKEPLQRGIEQVLVVDDENAIASMIQKMLERLGYSVVSRTSSVDALEAFQANPDKFDLVITDMSMPNMSGDKLASELIKIRPDISILLCTGFSEKLSEERATTLGIKSFLMKPIVMKDLSNTVRRVLDNRST